MSSKLTELAESLPSAPPPSVLYGSGILSQFSSPSMASSGHFDSTQVYASYKAKQAFNIRRYLCSKKDGPFGKEFPVSEAPTIDGTSGYSAYAEGSDELDGEEVEVIPHSTGHPSKSSPSQPPAERFQSQVIPSTPRNFQPTFAKIPTSIPPASPHSSHTNPALNPAVRPSAVRQSRNSPIVNSKQLQPVASTSRRREEISPLPFPASQVFNRRDQWPSQLTEVTQIRRVIIRMLSPGYLGGLIEIVGR
ncbi:hypothetical protein O181_035060 [Austropuccinia psidii MF-1]|uniref:Uncharacterized protein n=1 Tax=Austropuccinia psidii MF-1 TaxID=1389203 RepID=A0A9Q3D437_9BASI|nr:hypothetical protein [Austropuccinia psidii MF-1]